MPKRSLSCSHQRRKTIWSDKSSPIKSSKWIKRTRIQISSLIRCWKLTRILWKMQRQNLLSWLRSTVRAQTWKRLKSTIVCLQKSKRWSSQRAVWSLRTEESVRSTNNTKLTITSCWTMECIMTLTLRRRTVCRVISKATTRSRRKIRLKRMSSYKNWKRWYCSKRLKAASSARVRRVLRLPSRLLKWRRSVSLSFLYYMFGGFLDEELIEEAAALGYLPGVLRSYLAKNELNNATATYYLLQSKKQSNLVDTTTQKKKEWARPSKGSKRLTHTVDHTHTSQQQQSQALSEEQGPSWLCAWVHGNMSYKG